VEYGKADRFGVWLEPYLSGEAGQEGLFRGVVWDGENETTPREWKTLAPQSVLPLGQLLAGNEIEERLSEPAARPLVGPLAGLSSALWVPVQHAGKLRGILLAGANTQPHELPREYMRGVAAELAMVLAFETERRLARERHADIALCGRILAKLNDSMAPE